MSAVLEVQTSKPVKTAKVSAEQKRYWKKVNETAIERSTDDYACTFTADDSKESILRTLKLARR